MTNKHDERVEELKNHCWTDRNGDHQMPLDEVLAILTTHTKEVREQTLAEVREGLPDKEQDTCEKDADCPWCQRDMYCRDRQEEIGHNDCRQSVLELLDTLDNNK